MIIVIKLRSQRATASHHPKYSITNQQLSNFNLREAFKRIKKVSYVLHSHNTFFFNIFTCTHLKTKTTKDNELS